MNKTGKVWLVGAGPGDPELLTLKAAKLLENAETVVYDYLVGPEILAMLPPTAECIYAGKQAAHHTLPQPDINALLIALAQSGKQVIRLKGGDPFIFGRGGEEMSALQDAGIECAVIPGVTAAAGCAASAGFPLTHRDHAQALTLVTGHLKQGHLDLAWPALSKSGQTLVFYMGIGAAQQICEQLIAHGTPPDTPAIVVRHGTRPDQAIVQADLTTLPEAIKTSGIQPPGLIIVGQVVGLRKAKPEEIAARIEKSA